MGALDFQQLCRAVVVAIIGELRGQLSVGRGRWSYFDASWGLIQMSLVGLACALLSLWAGVVVLEKDKDGYTSEVRNLPEVMSCSTFVGFDEARKLDDVFRLLDPILITYTLF